MDDKNLNPDQEISENEQPAETVEENLPETPETGEENSSETPETIEIVEDDSCETSDYEKFLENQKEVFPEDGAEEAVTDPEEVELAPEKKKKKSKVLNGILIALIIVLFAASGIMIGWLIKNSRQSIDVNKVVLSVDGVDSTAAEFICTYNSYKSQSYGQLTDEQLLEYTLNSLAYTNAVYARAKEAGVELDDKDISEMDNAMAEYKAYAETSSMTIDELIADNYGANIDSVILRAIWEKNALCNKYLSAEVEKISDKCSADKAAIEKEYADNKKEYDMVDTTYYYVDMSEEKASENVEKIVKAVEGGKTLGEAVKLVLGKDAQDPADLKGYKYSSVASSFSSDVADWIYATNDKGEYTTAAGSIKQFEVNGAMYIVYINNVPARDETINFVADYISVSAVSGGDIEKPESALMIEAKNTAKKILDEFKKGPQDEDGFGAVLQNYRSDSVSGGAYSSEQTSKKIDAIEKWASEEDRKIGDTAIVEDGNVCYVLFFCDKAENPAWYQSILNDMISKLASDFQDEIEKSYENKVEKDETFIENIVASINAA